MDTPGITMAKKSSPKSDFCTTCASEVLTMLRDAAVSCEFYPLGTLLQDALDEVQQLDADGKGTACTCSMGTDGLLNTMQKGEALQLLEFVSAIAMLDDDGRDKLAAELETVQLNNLLDQLH